MSNKILIAMIAASAALVLLGGLAGLAGRDADVAASEGVTRFATFQREFGKRYGSPEEMEYRLGVFLANAAMIDAHNAAGNSSYTLGLNQFADLTFQEFSAYYASPPLPEVLPRAEDGLSEEPAEPAMKLIGDGDVDWNKMGMVSPVKDSTGCGASYAFAAIGALESAAAIFNRQAGLSLSEQEIIDCNELYPNDGCAGGWAWHAFEYIKKKGVNTDTAYPFAKKKNTCNWSLAGKGATRVSSVTRLGSNVDNLVRAVTQQPVAAHFALQYDFQFFKEGIYNPASCSGEVNFGILVTGFNTNTPIPYFRMKNSWGKKWGIDGYANFAIKTLYGLCRIAVHDHNAFALP